MSAREDLARLINNGVGTWRTPLEAADAILRAGYGNLADAWDEGHQTPVEREMDDCRCGAWSEGECGCGKYGTGKIITPNPYRSES